LQLEVLRVERFTPQPLDDLASVNSAFEVVLAKSGITLTVPPERSILEVVNEAGAGVLSTCQEGTCGTCEVRVLEGEPEHRDSVLTASERAANETMMICVSRCRGKRLVLDL
jgi:ferredoxin